MQKGWENMDENLTENLTENVNEGIDEELKESLNENSGEAEDISGFENESRDDSETAGQDEDDVKRNQNAQSHEENSRFAEMRRRSQYRELSDRVERFAKQSGYGSFGEMESAQKQKEIDDFTSDFEKKTGLNYEDIKKAVLHIEKNSPAMEVLSRLAHDAEKNAAESALRKGMEKISELYGEKITSFGELEKLPRFEEFDRIARTGMPIEDAFKLSHFDYLLERAGQKGKTSAIKQFGSKNHLSPAKGSSEDGVSVPPEIMEEYKIFNPKASDKEIAEHYKRHLKEISGR